MNQSLQGIIFAAGSLVLAGATWVFGWHLLPSRAEAAEAGTTIPWLVIWTMIWLTTLSALALAGFLMTNLKRNSE